MNQKTQQSTHPFIQCEHVTAGPSSPVHLRLASADGETFPGGGLPKGTLSLCFMEMSRGWDLTALMEQEVALLRDRIPQGSPGALCTRCAAIASKQPLTEHAEQINRAYPDRSAGRWCAICGQSGTHHTDRHGDFLLGARIELSSS